MKTRYTLTLICTVLAISALSLPFIISETSPKPEIPNNIDLQLIDTLVEFGCSELAIYHLMNYSNLLNEEYDGVYYLEWIGLPDGLSKEDFDKCLQIATSIRESNYTTTSEPQPLTLEQMEDNLDQTPREKHESTHEKGEYSAPRDLSLRSNSETITLQPTLTEEQLDDQIDIVFGNARKSWTVFPGGVGFVPPQNSTLVRIYKEVDFGMTPLNFTAMLDDKIFVDRCESNDGVWNYTYHDCEGIWEICQAVGGIVIQRNVTTPCTDICLDRAIYRMSCVFEYED